MQQEKLEWVDNLKGLAILSVVLGHIATPLTAFIFSWHMPVFLFLSGFFISGKRPIKESLKKDLKRLILPFLIFGFVGLVAEITKRAIFPDYNFAFENFVLIKEIVGWLFWMDFTHMHQYGFVLWFLLALFWGKLILQFSIKNIKSKALIGIICLALFFAFVNQSFILPFSLDKGLFSLVWLFGGYLYYNYCIKADSRIEIFFILLAVVILIILPIPMLNIAIKSAQTPLDSLFYSFSIIILLVNIYKRLGQKYLNNIFLKRWGQSSLTILILHPYTNNIGYIVANKFFHGNWVAIFILSVFILIILLSTIKYARKKLENSGAAYRFQQARAN